MKFKIHLSNGETDWWEEYYVAVIVSCWQATVYARSVISRYNSISLKEKPCHLIEVEINEKPLQSVLPDWDSAFSEPVEQFEE